MSPACLPLRKLESEVTEIWRGSGRREGTIRQYRSWGRRFEDYCADHDLSPIAELTRRGAIDFAEGYASIRNIQRCDTRRCAQVALQAWSFALDAIGHSVPEWTPKPRPQRQPTLLREYGLYRLRHQGVAESTVRADQRYVVQFLARLGSQTTDLSHLHLSDIDEFLISLSERLSRRTIAGVATALRSFLRFLHASGRLPHDLASAVKAPLVRAGSRPPRSIPWSEVRAILSGIHRDRRTGCRDFALLLMMATYGMGAAEVLGLRLDDVDWAHGIVHVKRPKTGAQTNLPLLPAIGAALSDYLRNSRPRYTSAREIFVSAKIPHRRLTATAICHILRHHARAAGVRPRFLGSHVLRHSHASFQIDHGAPPQVVSDILGHRDPRSTSAYILVAMRRLRGLALPVPK